MACQSFRDRNVLLHIHTNASPRAARQGRASVGVCTTFKVVPTQGAIPEKGGYKKKDLNQNNNISNHVVVLQDPLFCCSKNQEIQIIGLRP